MQSTQCTRRSEVPGFCSFCSIKQTSICAEMDENEIREISRTMAHLPIKDGQAIISQGDQSDSLSIVVSGSFRMVRMLDDGRRQITGFVFPGDFVGLNYTDSAPNTVEALEPSLLCRFSHKYLSQMSEKHPGIKDRLLSRGQSELNKAQDHIVLLGKKTAEERLLSFLEMVAKHQRGSGIDKNRVFLSMPRQDIADYLGLRLETLSRTFSALRKSGQIGETSGRIVELSNPCEVTG